MIRRRFLTSSIVMLLLVGLAQVGSAQSHIIHFPLGLMGPSGDGPPELGSELFKLGEVADGGFNIVFEFRSIEAPWEARQYLRRAENEGLQVVQNLPACRAYENNIPECVENPVDLWTEAEWAEFIEAAAPFDNLVGWYLPDEINDYTAAANLARWVQTYDPQDRPVYGNPGSLNQTDIDRFVTFTDFLWGVCYPTLYDKPRAFTTHMMKMDARACEGTDTKWGAILQFFDNSSFPRYGRQGHPTARELRSDTYQAIIGGATGLWYFNYEMGKADGLDELWDEMLTIRREIIGSGGLDDVILAPDVAQGVGKRILSGPTQSPETESQFYDSIQYLAKWRRNDGTYIFAANIATDTVQVQFRNLWAEVDSVEVLFEGRTIPIVDDSFTDTFAQDDVHIYYYAAPEPSEPLARLSVSVTDSPDPVMVDKTLTYRLDYANDGPSDAKDVTITSTLPPGVTFGGVASAVPALPAPTVTPQTLTWHMPTLAADVSGTIVYTVTVDPSAENEITSTAEIASSTPDDNLEDNQDASSTLVTYVADLVVTQSGDPDTAVTGVPLTYAVTIANNGPSAATGAKLTDWLPDGVTVASVESSQGNCNQTGTLLVCDLGTIARDANATVDITVIPRVVGTITNSAHVTGDEIDPYTDNNTATKETEVETRIYLPFLSRRR